MEHCIKIKNLEDDLAVLDCLKNFHNQTFEDEEKNKDFVSNKKAERFKLLFNLKFQNKGLVKLRRFSQNESFNKNIFFSDEKGWWKFPTEKFDEICFNIFEEIGIKNENQQNKILKSFLAPYTISAEDLNKDGDKYLALFDGYYISLKDIENKAYANVSELWSDKDSWIKTHDELKAKKITMHAKITLPTCIDFEKEKEEFAMFRNLLLDSLGGREDSFVWLFDEFARHLSNYSRDQGFVHAVGHGGSGKSTFINSMIDLFGDYAVVIPFKKILEENEETKRIFFKNRHARFFSISEPNYGEYDFGFLKGLTANTKFSVNEQEFSLHSCFLFDSNFVFKTKFEDSGVERRYHLVGFGRTGKENLSNLEDVYKKLAQTIFLELLVRFSNLDLNAIVSHPPITQEIIQLFQYANDPIKFFLEKCYSPNPSNKSRLDVNRLEKITYQELIPFHKSYCETHFFYDTYMNQGVYDDFKISKFYKQLMIIHSNYAYTARQPVFYSISLGRPEPFDDMKQKVKFEVLNSGIMLSEIEIEKKIRAASEKPSVDREQEIEDLSFMEYDKGCFSFSSFNVSKFQYSEERWKTNIINFLCLNYLQCNTVAIRKFCDWVAMILCNHNMFTRVTSILDYRIKQNFCSFASCVLDTEIDNILSIIFQEYKKFVQINYANIIEKKESLELISMPSCK